MKCYVELLIIFNVGEKKVKLKVLGENLHFLDFKMINIEDDVKMGQIKANQIKQKEICTHHWLV